MRGTGGFALSDLCRCRRRRICGGSSPSFPRSHGVPRVDDRRAALSGILFVIRNGLRWRDAPAAYGHKTIYNRQSAGAVWVCSTASWRNWPRSGGADKLMIDATHLRRIRTAASLLKKGLYPDVSDVQQGRPDQEVAGGLRRQSDGLPCSCISPRGRPTTTRPPPPSSISCRPPASCSPTGPTVRAAFGQALTDRGVTLCIPPHAKHRVQYPLRPHPSAGSAIASRTSFARLADWRRIHTRYDRCAHTFLSAIASRRNLHPLDQ